MRRGIKFSKRAYIFLAFTAIFNLSSIVFDQLVVQQEDKIRKFDHIINEQKQEVYANLNSHKIFNELFFKVHFNAADLITDLNYLVRATNFFNGDLPKKIEENKIKKIKKIYIQKTKNIITKFEKSVTDSQLIFSKVKNDKAFIKFTKKERPVDDWRNPLFPLLRLEKDFRKLKNKIQYDYLSNYNFNAKTTKEQSNNHPIYSRIYNDVLDLNSLKFELDDLADSFKVEFNKSFAIYYILLDENAELNNFKNYLILLSILFQIIGLVSLIILFRILIIENK